MPRRFFPGTISSFKIASVVFIIAGFSFIAAPAQAGFQATGFQWVAPAESPSPPVSAAPNYPAMSNEAPPPALTPAPSIPVAHSAPIPVTPLAGESPDMPSPVVIEGTPVQSQPMATSPMYNQAPGAEAGNLSLPNTTVQGFANNVPLAVALREVLPPGYGFSIDQDVDLGTLVSFQGGRPWRDTLQSMLAPASLEMRETKIEMVAIGRVGAKCAKSDDNFQRR